MATYIIIGGDQKEYGPIHADDVRQWIAEGRLNEHSLIKAEGDAEFRALGIFSEFASAFAPTSAIPKLPPSAFAVGHKSPKTDYELDLGSCISRGWGLVKNNFGTLFVCLLLVGSVWLAFFGTLGLAASVIVPKHLMAVPGFKVGFNLLLLAVSALVMGPLVAGYYLVCLKTIRGEPTGVGDIFSGFQKSFWQLVLGFMVVGLVTDFTGVCMAPFNYLIAMKIDPLVAQMQNASPADIQNLSPQILSAFVSVVPILFICLIPVSYLWVNWLFALPLIIDRELDFRTAMKVSWKMVHKHWWHVFGLVVITGLLNVAGVFACGVGLLFTMPVGIAALMFAYETIFSERQAP